MKLLLSLFSCIFCFISSFAQSYQDEVYTSYFQRDDEGWNAADGTISIGLPDGRVFWAFGDTYVGQIIGDTGNLPCIFNSRNTAMVQDAINTSVFSTLWNQEGNDSYEGQLVNLPDEFQNTFWPGDGFVNNNLLHVFYTRWNYDPTQVWNLGLEGMVVATFNLPSLELISVDPIQDQGIEYGMAIEKDPYSNYYYVYGKEIVDYIHRPKLARFTYENLLGQWEYYAGNGVWSTNPENAIFVSEEASAEFSVFYLNGEYHMLYQENGYLACGFGRDIYIYSSSNPEGPFDNPTLVYTVEDQFYDVYPVTYGAHAHPIHIENDELLISYNVNNVCPNLCAADPEHTVFDPDLYRPKFARVPITMFTDPLSISENKFEEPKIFPNPSNTGVFTIDINNVKSTKVYSVSGQKVKTFYSNTIDLSKYPSGLYFAQLETQGTIRTLKLIKN